MRKNNYGVTLIALVITIIVLLILAGVTFLTLTGQNGVLTKTNQSKEENNKQTAKEILNLKITNVQMSKYAEEQRMPTLKELAYFLDPEKDKDIKSVTKTSQKVSSLDWINDNDYSSIFTILKDYPQYEFEIDKDLKLAKINGVKIADNTTSNDEKIQELETKIGTLENEIKTIKEQKSSIEKTKLLNEPIKISLDRVASEALTEEDLGNITLLDSIQKYKYLTIEFDLMDPGTTEGYAEETIWVSVEQLNYNSSNRLNLANNSLIGIDGCVSDPSIKLGIGIWFKNDRELHIGGRWGPDINYGSFRIRNIYGIE